MQSRGQPLLKFREGEDGDESAYLAPEGLALLDTLPESASLCPIMLMGDGRAGKSYISSRILGVKDAFVSSDSAEPVTEGIDIFVAPLAPLLKEQGLEANSSAGEEYILMLDCEGGNNAMAAIRTLVNVFGTLIGTEVVFVANAMASEQTLSTLGQTIAARCVVNLGDGQKALEQELVFVVNKCALEYGEDALEKMLSTSYGGTRSELRESILGAFPHRAFHTVPIWDKPDFESQMAKLQKSVLEHRRPLMMGGLNVRKAQLKRLLEMIVSEIQLTSKVNLPSVNRYIVLDGFLKPLVKRLALNAKENRFPKLDDFDPDLQSKDCRHDVLIEFVGQAEHIKHVALIKEARDELKQMLDLAWEETVAKNAAIGNEIRQTLAETKEVILSTRGPRPLGGRGLLRDFPVHTEEFQMNTRSLIRFKSGEEQNTPWKPAGDVMARLVETSIEAYEQLPALEENLFETSSNEPAGFLSFGASNYKRQFCLLKEGHLFYYTLDNGGNVIHTESGHINFLVHSCKITADIMSPTCFCIESTRKSGWLEPHSFSGGSLRAFSFDCRPRVASDSSLLSYLAPFSITNFLQTVCCRGGGGTERPGKQPLQAEYCERRDIWVDALRCHIAFGDVVRTQISQERLIGAFHQKMQYSLDEVRGKRIDLGV